MNTNTSILKSTRPASWWIILAVIVGNSAVDLAMMTDTSAEALRSIARSTHGLVLPPLLMCAVGFAAIVVGLIFLKGRLRWSDVGLGRRRVPPGVAWVVGLWVVVQVVVACSHIAANEPLAIHAQWTQHPLHTVGRVLADWLGVAVYEETVFRGFLLTQLWLLCSAWLRGRRWIALGLALLVSQTIFALGHLPYLMTQKGIDPAALPADLLFLFGMGLLFSVVYLTTRNLLFAIALHAMINTPASLWQGSDTLVVSSVVVLTLTFVVPLALVYRFRSRNYTAARAGDSEPRSAL